MKSTYVTYKVQILDNFDLDILDDPEILQRWLTDIIDREDYLRGDGYWAEKAELVEIRPPNVILRQLQRFD